MNSRTMMMAGSVAAALLAASAAQAKTTTITTFADFSQVNAVADLAWDNPIVPAVYNTIPAVTQYVPAVTQTTPAVYQTIPAVYKTVNGKQVLVTPAKTVLVTPAKTVVITPAYTKIITPAQKVLVTPAHDSSAGTLQSTNTNKGTYATTTTNFSFLYKKLTTLKNLKADFTFKATTPVNDPALTVGGLLEEPNLSGTFSFTYAGSAPLKVWDSTYYTGANLLSGTFTDMTLSGAINGSSGGATTSTSGGGSVVFTSDFLNFSHTVGRDIGIQLTSIKKPLQVTYPNAALHTFIASAGGAFSSNPAPIISAVPETGTWALMMAGIGMVGLSLRVSRRRTATLAA